MSSVDDGPMSSAGSLTVAATLRQVVTDRASQRFAVPVHVLARSVGGDTVLLDLHKDEYFSLSHVGTKIWALVVEGATFGSIVDRITEDYGVERERVEKDVTALVDDLVATGLLTEV